MPIFVIQEHKATNLHWDFRLQLDGVLKSWALPKPPPTQPRMKRLAVQVEDHDLDYANFEGEIKEGYGKGKVKIWDRGEFDMFYNGRDKIEFELFGEKMKGKYILLNAKLSGDKKNWLFFKKED